ncbi:indolethylamine N-methyltransferase-like [Dendropsophus ebraccatus]|uniref:indolethylamine N-methyltransferase-like n=1 Tax=Dendropsophus ebraccatus TaxID=150705 RepID=UPI00383189DB
MASSTLKHYHDEEFDSKLFNETFFSHGGISIIEENMVYPAKILHDLFSSGEVKGEILLDISMGSIMYQLISASNYFKDIYVLEFTDANLKHFKKWLAKEEGATDWSFACQKVCEFEGIGDMSKEKEDQVRRKIKEVIKWEDYEKSCMSPQLVPEVDCVLSLWVLIPISKTKKDFQRNLKEFTSRLKIGGHLILFVGLNMTFYKMGKHKYCFLSVDEDFVRESVIKAGLVIEKVDSLPRKVDTDIVDYKHLLFVLARK